ncbi:MAG: hypothetical protein R3F59_16685 [Myxococcota bacterium]
MGRTVGLVTLGWLLGCAGLGGSGASGPGADAMVLHQQTLTDPGMGGMPSHTVLVPDGWTASGGAWWAPPAAFNVVPSQDIRVEAPDGRKLPVGPALSFTWFDPAPFLGMPPPKEGQADNGTPMMRLPPSPDAWRPLVEKAVADNEPGAQDIQVTDIVEVPEVTALLTPTVEQIRQQQQSMNQFGARPFVGAVALGASATYTREGKAWDTMLVFGVLWLGSDMQTGRQTWWGIEPNLGFRAPKGALELSMPLLVSLATSVQPTPQWAQMKQEHIAKLQGIAMKGARDRSAILSQTAKIRDDAFEQRMASMDATQRRIVNGIREVDDYVSPSGSSAVQLPSGYDNVYSNGQGDFLLTNSALFDPNVDRAFNDTSWETMQRQP